MAGRSPRLVLSVAALMLAAAACSDSPAATAVTTATGVSASGTTTTAPSRPRFCAVRVDPVQVGTLQSSELDEVSGAVLSRTRPGILWLHNDSGNEPAVFAVTLDGVLEQRVALPDLAARDWEDIAIGPGPDPALDYLYLADIGDNRGRRESIAIHRLPEPAVGIEMATGGETMEVTYPDGPTEAETLLVDPETGDMVIATKALSGVTRLYGVAGDRDWATAQTAVLVGEIRLGAFAVATGGDATADRIVIRTYDEVFLWDRSGAGSLGEDLREPGCRVANVSEEQGEAIALGDDGTFYTVSEGIAPPIYRFG